MTDTTAGANKGTEAESMTVSNLITSIQEISGGPMDLNHDASLEAAMLELHSGITDAYKNLENREINWIDPMTGNATEPGQGAAFGLPAELAMVACQAIWLIGKLGLDPAAVLTDVVKSLKLYADADDLDDLNTLDEISDETTELEDAPAPVVLKP